MPKVTQQYRDARRDQILSAARRCFLRDGFHATSMQDLFAEAGLSSGAVYRYFASKDDVIIAIAEENMRDVVEMIHGVATQQPGRSVGAAVADVLEILRTKDAQNGLGGLALLAWAEALRNPSLAERFKELLTQMHTDLAEVVREHQNTEDLPQGVPADALAAVLISIVPGYILQLTLLGAAAVEGVPGAVRALWP
jgi:TetR/AcrR family transcriptional regulator, transcriptional repressor of aconitase